MEINKKEEKIEHSPEEERAIILKNAQDKAVEDEAFFRRYIMDCLDKIEHDKIKNVAERIKKIEDKMGID